MKHIIIIILLFLSHCQSVTNYLQYRAYDFRDMFTIGVEKNVAGGSFFIWCIGGGLQYGSEGNGYGIRGGNFGEYTTGYSGNVTPHRTVTQSGKFRKNIKFSQENFFPKYGSSIIIENTFEHISMKADLLRIKNKNYAGINQAFIIIPLHTVSESNCLLDKEFCELAKYGRYCNAPFQIESSLGLYFIGVRFGFNFYEALDFIAGIFGADLLNDDTLAPMTEKDRREMLSRIHHDNSGTHLAWMGESCSRDRICSEGLCVNSICQDKEIQNTKNWTGGFCNKHHHCKNGVCLDGTCMAKEMENTYPWKCNEKGCGVSGASCKLDTECKGICVNGKCQ